MSAFERFAVVRVPFSFTDRQAQKRPPAVSDDHFSTPILLAPGLADGGFAGRRSGSALRGAAKSVHPGRS